METWHGSERNKICKHAKGKSAGGVGWRLRDMKQLQENKIKFTQKKKKGGKTSSEFHFLLIFI